MADWILVPSLVSLRAEINALAPNRDKATDGSKGDESHSGSNSDHNPDETGKTSYEDSDSTNEVHAIDVDVDLRKPGWNMQRVVDIIVARHKSGVDDRLQYVIYDRTIYSRSWGWTPRYYDGDSPHTGHAHFSARYTTAQESSTRPWGLLAADEKEDNVTPAEFLTILANPDVAARMKTLAGQGWHEQKLGASDTKAAVAAQETFRTVLALATAVAGIDQVDETALAAALIPGLAATILAGLPEDGTLTLAEVEQSVRNVLLTGAAPPA